MSPQDIKATLIRRTIEVIANEGLDKTTTKAIVSGTGINEVYIYRHFADKEDLLAKVFIELDEELADETMKNVSVFYDTSLEFEKRCRKYFFAIWDVLLSNREECIAYVRYYYSSYFIKNSLHSHIARYEPLIEIFKEAFIEEADVWMILTHILNVMLDFAVKVHNNQMPSDMSYYEHVYRVIYASVKQYFKETEEE